MKFSCLQENLIQGLNIVSRIASSNKSNLPILNNILLTTEDGFLKLSTTNLEMAIETKIRAKIKEQGKITIPAQLFNNYIGFISEDEVLDFEIIKNEISIKSKDQKTKIKGISAEEFPIIPQIENQEEYILKSSILKDALEKTIFSISFSEVRIELSGAFFSFNDPMENKLTIVGTDSYRLTEKQISMEKTKLKTKKSVIIPVKTLQEVLKIIKDKENVEIQVSENQVLFIYGETQVISRLISGEFPNYKQTIPESYKTKAIINRENFLMAAKRSSFFARSGVNDINLKFLPKENQIIIFSLNSQIGENKTTLKADITGEDNEIVFNHRYLIDGLSNINGKEISLEIVNDDTPGSLKPLDDKFYLYLIMPIKNN